MLDALELKMLTELHTMVTGNGTPENGLCFKVARIEDNIKDMSIGISTAKKNALQAVEIAKGNAVDTPEELINAGVKIADKAIKSGWFDRNKKWIIPTLFVLGGAGGAEGAKSIFKIAAEILMKMSGGN